MKAKVFLFLAMMILSLGLVGAPVSMAAGITFQGVDFVIQDSNPLDNMFTLEINNISGAGGDWTGIQYLSDFSLKDVGGATLTGASPGTWGVSNFELKAYGCSGPGGGSGNFCFTSTPLPYKLGNDNTFTITYTGALDISAPHLKVSFMKTQDQLKKTGSLLSATVPEPTSLMLLGVGLFAVGIWRRRFV